MIIKKLRFLSDEVSEVQRKFDGYIWVAVDIKKAIIAAGDEYIARLREALVQIGSIKEDILGVGVDLFSGEIYPYTPINPNSRLSKLDHHRVPDEAYQRLEDIIDYFFIEFPCFKEKHRRGRFYKKPQSTRAVAYFYK